MTICSHDRRYLFGDIVQGEMRLNDVGRMTLRWWKELPNRFPTVELDEFVIMPNHVHGIVVIVGADLCVGPDHRVGPAGARAGASIRDGADPGAPERDEGARAGAPRRRVALPQIVQWFKTMTANEYIRGLKQHRWPRCTSKLWQRNYYEHVIRNEEELYRIRQYIADNAANWASDWENPNAQPDKQHLLPWEPKDQDHSPTTE